MTESTENAIPPQKPKEEIVYHVSPSLEYKYRDVFRVYIGQGDVILEFGNKNRSMPGHITISDRIVLTVANAFTLQEGLQKSLIAAQIQLQQQMSEKNRNEER
jgi:hypothetical protein